MSNSFRFKPVIDGKKECSKCGENKELETGFHFNSSQSYYGGTCRDCINKERRDKYAPFIVDTKNVKEDRRKICIVCHVEKPLDKEHFRKSNKRFVNVCIECIEEKKEKLKIDKHPEVNKTLPRTCTICGETKTCGDFAYTSTTGYFQGDCKECRNKKYKETRTPEKVKIKNEQTKNWYNGVGKYKKFVTSYRNFDFYRGLDNDLDEQYIKDSLDKSCTYCGHPSEGVDRLDNKIGHIKSNCIPACKCCNVARNSNFTHEEMLLLGKTIKEIKDKRNDKKYN